MAAQLALPLNVHDTGEVRLYRMMLPFLPPSKNVYDGWQAMWQSGHKKKWIRAIAEQVEELDMPLGVQQIGLAATLVFPSKNRRDPQNYASTLWNFVPDGLVRAGVVSDDREGQVQIGPNWGVKFAYDLRATVDKRFRSKTLLAVTMRVATDE